MQSIKTFLMVNDKFSIIINIKITTYIKTLNSFTLTSQSEFNDHHTLNWNGNDGIRPRWTWSALQCLQDIPFHIFSIFRDRRQPRLRSKLQSHTKQRAVQIRNAICMWLNCTLDMLLCSAFIHTHFATLVVMMMLRVSPSMVTAVYFRFLLNALHIFHGNSDISFGIFKFIFQVNRMCG